MSFLCSLDNISARKTLNVDMMGNLLDSLDSFSRNKSPAALQDLAKAKGLVIDNPDENLESKQWKSLCERMKDLDVNTCMETLLILREMSESLNGRCSFIINFLDYIKNPLRFLLSLGSSRVGYCALKLLSHIQDDYDSEAYFVKVHLVESYSDVITPYSNEEIIRVACFEENLVTSDPAFYEIQGISDFKQVADVANKILKRFN